MRITKLRLEKVACFDRLDIDFQKGADPQKADIHLIVGANGTGKSTILMALAQFFTSDHHLGLDKRFLDAQSLVSVMTEDGEIAAFMPVNYATPDPKEVFSKPIRLFAHDFRNQYSYYSENQSIDSYRKLCRVNAATNSLPPQKTSFAVFGYSGFRSTQDFKLRAIQEQDDYPLGNALMFSNPTASQELIQWVANTVAKEAFARNRGDDERARQRRESIARIENIISNIIEQPFAFVLNEEPLDVLIDVAGQALDLELLPDGLKSIVSWVADLLMRLDRTPWKDDIPVLERPFLLFLDEIEVHLHPAWQRKILPAIQDLFPNAQVFVSTHSPFVIASADDAWIYPLERKGRYSTLREPIPSMKGNSYATILREALGIDAEFSPQVETLFDQFYRARDSALRGDPIAFEEMNHIKDRLAVFGEEVNAIVIPELRQTIRRIDAMKQGTSK